MQKTQVIELEKKMFMDYGGLGGLVVCFLCTFKG